jgi:hypothetical protein
MTLASAFLTSGDNARSVEGFSATIDSSTSTARSLSSTSSTLPTSAAISGFFIFKLIRARLVSCSSPFSCAPFASISTVDSGVGWGLGGIVTLTVGMGKPAGEGEPFRFRLMSGGGGGASTD